MSERSVQPISSVRASESGLTAKVMASDRMHNSAEREYAVPNVEKSMKQTETEKAQALHLSNISIHFNVDEETNRLIVIVTERDSGRVIRTIPANEFEKLHAGDLLKLTA